MVATFLVSVKKVWKRCGGNRRKEKSAVPGTAGRIRRSADCPFIIARKEEYGKMGTKCAIISDTLGEKGEEERICGKLIP